MLHFLGILTAIAVVISGFTVIKLGEWRPHGLKFAGITLSTLAACWMVATTLLLPSHECTQSELLCTSYSLYHVVRNLAFLIFHVAIGRDAIQFRGCDRRCSSNQLDRRVA